MYEEAGARARRSSEMKKRCWQQRVSRLTGSDSSSRSGNRSWISKMQNGKNSWCRGDNSSPFLKAQQSVPVPELYAKIRRPADLAVLAFHEIPSSFKTSTRKLWPQDQIQPATCYCKLSLIVTQPRPSITVLSVTTCTPQ